MFRIKHVIPTVAVTLATAALITPAAQARPVTGPPSAESSNAAAVAKAVQRLREQWWSLLEKEVARTVSDPAQIADEVEFIKSVFWRSAGGGPGRSDQQGQN